MSGEKTWRQLHKNTASNIKQVNDVMPGSDGLRIWGDFWKKAVCWDLRQDKASWDSNLGEASPVVCCGVRVRLLGQ